MNKEELVNAIGMADDRYIADAHEKITVKHLHFGKIMAAAAAVVIALGAPLPIATAAGSENAYELLYMIAPPVAQTFKPVQRSCTYNGIEMNVISAKIEGSKAEAMLSIRDLEGDRLDENTDLFDSYHFHLPFDGVGTCSFSHFDAETHTAFFIVSEERMDGKDITDSKITFSIHQIITHKTKTEGFIDGIDLANSPNEPVTFGFDDDSGAWCSGFGVNSIHAEIPDESSFRRLETPDVPIASPVPESIDIMAYGIVDGLLHVQMRMNDNLHTDNHGFIRLKDANGNEYSSDYSYGFKFSDSPSDNYEEYVFGISTEKLADYRLYGEYVTAPPCIEGDWEVTFTVEK